MDKPARPVRAKRLLPAKAVTKRQKLPAPQLKALCVESPRGQRILDVPLDMSIAELIKHIEHSLETECGVELRVKRLTYKGSGAELNAESSVAVACGALRVHETREALTIKLQRCRVRVECGGVAEEWKFQRYETTADAAERMRLRMAKLPDASALRPAAPPLQQLGALRDGVLRLDAVEIPPEERRVVLRDARHVVTRFANYIEIESNELRDALKSWASWASLYESPPRAEMSVLVRELGGPLDRVATLQNLFAYVAQNSEPIVGPIKAALGERSIMWDGLWYAFPRDALVYSRAEDVLLRVAERGYEETRDGEAFYCQGLVVKPRVRDGQVKYGLFEHRLRVAQYGGAGGAAMALAELDLVRVETLPEAEREALLARLEARADRFEALCKQPYAYLQHGTEQDVHARVVVDVRQGAPQLYARSVCTEVLPLLRAQDRLFCWPRVPCYWLERREWCDLRIDALRPIAFAVDAFADLVLPPQTEAILRACLVPLPRGDIVGGKALGTAVLLAGPPGTGKSTTALALAEHQRCPLFSIKVGELGVDAEELDTSLQQLLKLCAPWKAIVLLDEAETVTQERSASDLTRNAMVAAMLRIVESFEGTMILTTNHPRSIDCALWDRLACCIEYPDLDAAQRAQVLHNLLRNFGLAELLADKADNVVHIQALLRDRPLNGREICSAVKMAQRVALSRQPATPVASADLLLALRWAAAKAEMYNGSRGRVAELGRHATQ